MSIDGDLDPAVVDTSEDAPFLPRAPVSPPASPHWANRRFIVAWTIFLSTLFDFGLFLGLPAQNMVFERVICEQLGLVGHNATASGPGVPRDDPCKLPVVQSELGTVFGWRYTFSMIPSILFGMYWGRLSDRWGRRPVFFLAILGEALVEAATRSIVYWSNIFPIRAVWFAQMLYLVGGGGQIAQSMIFTILTDATEPAQRANAYVIQSAGVLVAEICATPIGAGMVEIMGPWIPYCISPVVMTSGSFLIWLLPETSPLRQATAAPQSNESMFSALAKQLHSARPRRIRRRIIQLTLSLPRLVWNHLTLACLITTYFVSYLSRQTTNFVVLYASKKFSWQLSRASVLLALRSGTNCVLLLLILPFASRILLQRYHFSTLRKDLYLLRAQALVIALGALMIAFSEQPWVLIIGVISFALGSAFSVNARSLATSIVEREVFARINVALAISQSAGIMAAGPLLASLWHHGLELDGPWLGLPFFGAACLFGIVCCLTWIIRIDDPSGREPSAEMLSPEHSEAETAD